MRVRYQSILYNFLGGVNLLPVPGEPERKSHVRPHDLHLLDAPATGTHPAEILHIHRVGPVVRVELKLTEEGGPLEAEIPRADFPAGKWKVGQTVHVLPRAAILYDGFDPMWSTETYDCQTPHS